MYENLKENSKKLIEIKNFFAKHDMLNIVGEEKFNQEYQKMLLDFQSSIDPVDIIELINKSETGSIAVNTLREMVKSHKLYVKENYYDKESNVYVPKAMVPSDEYRLAINAVREINKIEENNV